MPQSAGTSAPPVADRLDYRPGLDGVRATAVLSVIAFHLGASWLPGGYLGVDVFLVLSGFLITALLLAEHADTGRVAVGAFWARRARRLLPALLLLMVVLSAWAALAATPEQAVSLRTDAMAALLYVANWWFVADSAEYLAAADPSLLLHTWSLGVEEQWYVILPLLVVVLLRGRRSTSARLLVVFAGLAVASALLMAWLAAAGAEHARTYYGTDTRLFALLLGAMAATLVHRRGWPRPGVADLAGTAGLVALAVAATSLGALHPFAFRGGLVLVAIAATAVVVAAATPGTRVGRVLAWRPLVAVGVVSYGLYLWHWPVHRLLLDQPWWWRLALAGAAATISYVALERPIRSAQWHRIPLRVRPAIPVAALAAGAAVVVAATSAPGPLPAPAAGSQLASAVTGQVLRVARPSDVRDPRATEEPGPPRPRTTAPAEQRPAPRLPTRTLDVLVLGDSVAFSLAYHRPEPSLRLRVGGEHVLGCGITEQPLAFGGGGVLRRPHCKGYVARWPELVAEADPDVTLVVVGAWEVHDHVHRGDPVAMGSPEHDALVAAALRRGLDAVTAGGRAAVVTDVPCFGSPEPIDPRAQPLRVLHLNGLLARVVAAYPSARLVPLSDRLCPDGDDAGGAATRYDGVHFTARGAAEVWPWLDRQLRTAVAAQRSR
ncbi:MAG: acyltransferase [Candidatus Nanopelagicales bacterium]|jgi:peptidoglycan/LPS O-acetylase OafA/YrhL|nr:acyltransferase [Candidatus Nanopelagicales bacterium]